MQDILDTTNKWVRVASVDKHELTNAFQNQVIMLHTYLCNTESSDKISKIIHQLVKEQLSPRVHIETFDRNPLPFAYFRSMFQKSAQKKIEDH